MSMAMSLARVISVNGVNRVNRVNALAIGLTIGIIGESQWPGHWRQWYVSMAPMAVSTTPMARQ